MSDPDQRKATGKAESNGQPSEEYQNFESLMKRLIRTPKPTDGKTKVKPKRS